jgi:TRAP-type uncharacterized transport system fused permease subunit
MYSQFSGSMTATAFLEVFHGHTNRLGFGDCCAHRACGSGKALCKAHGGTAPRLLQRQGKKMSLLLTHWHCIVPVVVIIIIMLATNLDPECTSSRR